MLRRWIKSFFENVPVDIPDVSKSQWFSENDIKDYQLTCLKKIIRYVYKEIPYYRTLFKQLKITPRDIRELDDLAKIPVLTRKEAIKHYDQLVNPDLINFTHYSGATSGQRLKWVSSRPWAELFTATLWRGFSWAGLDPSLKVVSLYSRVIGEIVKNSLIIREAYDVDKIDDELEQIRNFNPDYAYCYSSGAYMMAQHLLQNNLRLPLKGVITTSDQLYSHYREAIEEAFQCKVFNNYGCNDGGAWGAECAERSGFHHDFERSIIEFDDNGKMIATDLWNYAMPLIRYENGDSGQWLNIKCPCNRAMPLFTIEGRINDYIITPTQVFSPTTIDVLLRNNQSIDDIQIVQQSASDIEIYFVRKPNYKLEDIKGSLEPVVSKFKGMNIILTEQTQIIRPASNKKRLCLNNSNITLDFLKDEKGRRTTCYKDEGP